MDRKPHRHASSSSLLAFRGFHLICEFSFGLAVPTCLRKTSSHLCGVGRGRNTGWRKQGVEEPQECGQRALRYSQSRSQPCDSPLLRAEDLSVMSPGGRTTQRAHRARTAAPGTWSCGQKAHSQRHRFAPGLQDPRLLSQVWGTWEQMIPASVGLGGRNSSWHLPQVPFQSFKSGQ